MCSSLEKFPITDVECLLNVSNEHIFFVSCLNSDYESFVSHARVYYLYNFFNSLLLSEWKTTDYLSWYYFTYYERSSFYFGMIRSTSPLKIMYTMFAYSPTKHIKWREIELIYICYQNEKENLFFNRLGLSTWESISRFSFWTHSRIHFHLGRSKDSISWGYLLFPASDLFSIAPRCRSLSKADISGQS